MQINNNIDAMMAQQIQMNQLAKNIAETANIIGDPELQEVTQDLVDSITQQIPVQIAYDANAQSVKAQNELQNSLLNLKA